MPCYNYGVLTYELPKELIAQQPCEPRDAAKLLVLDRATSFISHRLFRDLPELLRPGDCLVLNDTRVIPARIYGRKAITGGRVELLLLGKMGARSAPAGPTDRAPGTKEGENPEKCVSYRCLGQPAKNLRPGTRLQFDQGSLQAEVLAWENGERIVRFEGRGVEQTLRRVGEMPLPPYIDRPVQAEDTEWYQTVYAREAGAVAAPTAGLHFTEQLLEAIREKGVRIVFVTLHVGWGTFKPVGERELASGLLHPEQFWIPQETLEAIRDAKEKKGRVIAVGTTVVRALESWRGGLDGHRSVRPSDADLARPPDVPSQPPVPGLSESAAGSVEGTTDLFIRPPFQFRVVDALITNFHLPGTSLLLLVEAFAGEGPMRVAYEEAIRQRYRFYSYGDAMLIL